jgi:hypothetical protein
VTLQNWKEKKHLNIDYTYLLQIEEEAQKSGIEILTTVQLYDKTAS